MTDITNRLASIHRRIDSAAQACGRKPADIALLGVSKTRTIDRIRQAVAAGLTQFGENYLQEALPKMAALRDLAIQWHFIGPVQSNKTRDLATHFAWVQTVDREKIARRLNDQRSAWGDPLNICVQVNISREPQKAGVLPEAAAGLCRAITDMPRLKLRGLMVIPAATGDPEEQMRSFAATRALFDELNSQGLGMDTLSMGMSADLEAAIAQGSTMVRVGTDLFGPRE